jgi:hypothetical protein
MLFVDQKAADLQATTFSVILLKIWIRRHSMRSLATEPLLLEIRQKRFGALGSEDEDKLNLDPSLLDNDLYRLDLVEKGNQFPEIIIDLALEPRTYILDPLLSDG